MPQSHARAAHDRATPGKSAQERCLSGPRITCAVDEAAARSLADAIIEAVETEMPLSGRRRNDPATR